MTGPPSLDGSIRQLSQARALTELGRHQEAASILERLLAQSPEDPEALQLLTCAYLNLPDVERALACAGRCIAASPEDGVGHRYRASALAEQGRLDEAREAARRAVELSPDDVWTHYVLVDVLLKGSRAGDARDAATRLLALAPDWTSAHDSMGRVALAEKRFAEAEGHFKKALQIDPESAVAMNNLGAAFLDQRKHGEAVRFFWNGLRARPQSSAMQYNLTRALTGYFGFGFFAVATFTPPLVLIAAGKAGLFTDEQRALRVFWLYYLALATVWVVFRIVRHRALPTSVRSHLWQTVHLPAWQGVIGLAVFCGIVSSFFQAIYLYLWWSRGSYWAPGSPFAWRLFFAWTFYLLVCWAYVAGAWLRKRRLQ